MNRRCREGVHGKGKVEDRAPNGDVGRGYEEATRNGIKNTEERIPITIKGVASSSEVRRKLVKM